MRYARSKFKVLPTDSHRLSPILLFSSSSSELPFFLRRGRGGSSLRFKCDTRVQGSKISRVSGIRVTFIKESVKICVTLLSSFGGVGGGSLVARLLYQRDLQNLLEKKLVEISGNSCYFYKRIGENRCNLWAPFNFSLLTVCSAALLWANSLKIT